MINLPLNIIEMKSMICKDSFKRGDYKRVPQGISALSNTKRKGRGYYIKMPKSTSVDFVKKCREIEAEELHNSTAKEENSVIKEVIRWLKGH